MDTSKDNGELVAITFEIDFDTVFILRIDNLEFTFQSICNSSETNFT